MLCYYYVNLVYNVKKGVTEVKGEPFVQVATQNKLKERWNRLRCSVAPPTKNLLCIVYLHLGAVL